MIRSMIPSGTSFSASEVATVRLKSWKLHSISPSNPTRWDRLRQRLRESVIGALQRREAKARERHAF